jgi:hypothetical protein
MVKERKESYPPEDHREPIIVSAKDSLPATSQRKM